MISKKIKMIGLASILSLGVVGGAIAINEINPSEVMAANPNEVKKLTAEITNISSTGASMKVDGSNQTILQQRRIGVVITSQNIGKNEIKTTFTWAFNVAPYRPFYFQKITSMTIDLNSAVKGTSTNEWTVSSGSSIPFNGNFDGSGRVTFTFPQGLYNVDKFSVNQKIISQERKKPNNSSENTGTFWKMSLINIAFDCQNR